MGDSNNNTTDMNQFAQFIQQVAATTVQQQGSVTPHIRIKEPDVYKGTRDAVIIDSWIRSVERYNTVYKMNNELLLNYALTLLRERADAWYRTLEQTNTQPKEWETFKQLLKEKFRPNNADLLARDRLAAIHQTGTVQAYVDEFLDICLLIPNLNEEEQCDRFMRGLRSRGRGNTRGRGYNRGREYNRGRGSGRGRGGSSGRGRGGSSGRGRGYTSPCDKTKGFDKKI